MHGRIAMAFAALLALCVLGRTALAQTVSLHVDRRDLYAGLPFVLSVQAAGFEEKPEPKVAPFSVAGGRVTYIGVSPNVSRMVQIINGHTTQRSEVTYVFRYRIEAPTAGTYEIPVIRVEQGSRHAESQPVKFATREIEKSSDMRLRLELPKRPLWVGETFDVHLDWYLRRDVGDQTFVIPLFDLPAMTIEPPPGTPTSPNRRDGKTLPFLAGTKEVQLPYERSESTLDGKKYLRFRFSGRATAQTAGTFELKPATVVATLEVGEERDMFGFRVPSGKLFKAVEEGAANKLEIRALPMAGRPKSFKDAVGSDFALEVRADRTVVSVGEPIELDVTVRGKGRLEGLTMPPLDADGGMDPAHFTLPEDMPAGEIFGDGEKSTSGRGKRFRVVVRLRSAEVREIPALAFSYFDPETAEYRTVRSQPIALSVKGSTIVGGKDVVRSPSASGHAGQSEKGSSGVAKSAPSSGFFLSGVDLSLSPAERTLRRPVLVALSVMLAFLVLFLVEIALLVFLRERQMQGRKHKQGPREALQRALDVAATTPISSSASGVTRALVALAKSAGVSEAAYAGLVQRIETEAFNPSSASAPMTEARRNEVWMLATPWREHEAGVAKQKLSRRRALLFAACLLAGIGYVILRLAPDPNRGPAIDPFDARRGDRPASVIAATPEAASHATSSQVVESKLEAARAAYREALNERDRERRLATFERAAGLFREVVRLHPDRPELLADWGNASLGAEDLGSAVLAFRRSLYDAPANGRAAGNLAWARTQLPSWVPRPVTSSATESLLFWHAFLSRMERGCLAIILFVVWLGMIFPWLLLRKPGWPRLLFRLAIMPLLVWLAVEASLLFEHKQSADAVVVASDVVLRTADNQGAPSATANPLPAGTEITVEETRTDGGNSWVRASLASGIRGWLKEESIIRLIWYTTGD